MLYMDIKEKKGHMNSEEDAFPQAKKKKKSKKVFMLSKFKSTIVIHMSKTACQLIKTQNYFSVSNLLSYMFIYRFDT